MSNINENFKNYNDIRKTQNFQQSKNNQNGINYNSFQNYSIQNNYQKIQEPNIQQAQIQRHTVANLYPADNLFDIVSTKSALEFIPPDPQNNLQPKVTIKKINLNRSKVSNIFPNNYLNKNNRILNENLNRNIGEISINNSNINNTFNSKSPIKSENSINNESNFMNKILEDNNIFNNQNSKKQR